MVVLDRLWNRRRARSDVAATVWYVWLSLLVEMARMPVQTPKQLCDGLKIVLVEVAAPCALKMQSVLMHTAHHIHD